MRTSGAYELHQLVAQRNSLGQVDAHWSLGVIAQALQANCLGCRRRTLRRFVRLLDRCHEDTVAERNGSSCMGSGRLSLPKPSSIGGSATSGLRLWCFCHGSRLADKE